MLEEVTASSHDCTCNIFNNIRWMHTAQTTAASLAAGVRSEALASAVGHGSSAYPHEFFERLPEFRVEYRVDHRVDEAVHVAQPRGQYEHPDSG